MKLILLLIALVSCSTLELKHVFHKSTSDYGGGLYKRSVISRNRLKQFTMNTSLKYKVTNADGEKVPDISDKDTIMAIAEMTANAYKDPKSGGWIEIPGWNVTTGFGWEGDGIRGYLYGDNVNDIFVLVVKGTSAWGIDGGPSSTRDMFNDNMMFSCCCASILRNSVCGCGNKNQCNTNCLVKASNFEDSYYNLAQTIFVAVQNLYPTASIWLSGHSLGGAIAALVALTNNVPAVTFEAPGDLRYAWRIGLIPDIDRTKELFHGLHIYQFGNDKDPVFLGVCNGYTSICYLWSYIMETKCHIGKQCLFSTNATSTDIRHHSITSFIQTLQDWSGSIPSCQVEENCFKEECGQYQYTNTLDDQLQLF